MIESFLKNKKIRLREAINEPPSFTLHDAAGNEVLIPGARCFNYKFNINGVIYVEIGDFKDCSLDSLEIKVYNGDAFFDCGVRFNKLPWSIEEMFIDKKIQLTFKEYDSYNVNLRFVNLNASYGDASDVYYKANFIAKIIK